MPIRFRCVYCDKLLGIGRRKAGTVITCPHCGEKLIVPTPEPEEAAVSPPLPELQIPLTEEAASRLFEEDDFDVLLESNPIPTIRPSPPPIPAPPRFRDDGLPPKIRDEPPASQPYQFPVPPQLSLVESAAPAPQPLPLPSVSGIQLSKSRAILLAILGLILIAGAFIGGYFVGQNVHGP